MALVDYSSDDAGPGSDADADQTPAATTDNKSAPPPLPAAFHDLYAATVRTATADHPSLHHGRQRAIPHVAGQWPSHLYIEWNPSSRVHDRLGELLAALDSRLDAAATADGRSAAPLHSFLTSDLGAPLPLHISLSRPFVLPTAGKAGFLRQLTAAIHASGVGAFSVVFSDLFWYRGPDSARAFLVLRADVEGGDTEDGGADNDNAPLVALLDRCNTHVARAGQPPLYAHAGEAQSTARAFHVSIAWTLAGGDAIEAWRAPTEQVYAAWRSGMQTRGDVLRIRVASIKAKIGNVVTDMPLGRAAASAQTARPGKRPRDESADDDNRRDNKTKTSSKSHDTRRKKSLFGI